jgi:threonine/homoserine/homoserine lactone efflux protein
MENSLVLGLYHGFIYGIVPMAPWLVALKRYLYEGKQKGQLAVAGTIAGQVVFFAMTYFGWRDLIQIWYLLEPALFCAGFVMLIRIALDLWENIAYADLTYGPIRTRREGFNFFFASFFLMFCNPWEIEGTQYVFMASIPENVILYLLGFTLMAAGTVVGLWATVGYRIFGKTSRNARGLGRYTANRLALALTTCMALSLLETNAGQLIFPYTDNLMTYFPRTFDRYKLAVSRGYIWLPGADPNAPEIEASPSSSEESKRKTSEAKKKKVDATQKADDELQVHYSNIRSGNRSDVRVKQDPKNMWKNNIFYNVRQRFAKVNLKRERYIEDDEAYKEELTHHVWQGLTPRTFKLRAGIHSLLPKPDYEKRDIPEYLRELAQIRHEIDQNLTFLVPPSERSNYLPYSVDLNGSPYVSELDVRFTDAHYPKEGFRKHIYQKATNEFELEKIKTNSNKFLDSVPWEIDQYGNRVKPVGSYELMNMAHKRMGLSYAKLHELPAKFRVPWHYTSVPALEMRKTVTKEDLLKMSKEELLAKDKELSVQLRFLENKPKRIVTDEIFSRLPHVIRTGTAYPVSPELVAQKEAELAEAVAEAIEIRDLMEQSIPTPDLTKTEADVRRELNGNKPPVKLSQSAKQRLRSQNQ